MENWFLQKGVKISNYGKYDSNKKNVTQKVSENEEEVQKLIDETLSYRENICTENRTKSKLLHSCNLVHTYLLLGLSVEEPGEQCTVVFALIVMGPASECVCVRGYTPPPSSRFL